VADLKAANAPVAEVQAAEKALAACRRTRPRPRRPGPPPRPTPRPRQAAGRHAPHAAQFAGDPNGDEKAQKTFDESRRNFLALCSA
jgi:cation/acetate symporter